MHVSHFDEAQTLRFAQEKVPMECPLLLFRQHLCGFVHQLLYLLVSQRSSYCDVNIDRPLYSHPSCKFARKMLHDLARKLADR